MSSLVSQYHGMDLFMSTREMFQKNMHWNEYLKHIILQTNLVFQSIFKMWALNIHHSLLLAHHPHLFMTFMSQMQCTPVNYFCRWVELGYTMTHLVSPKCLLYTSTCIIMLIVFVSYFKKSPSMLNSCLFMNVTPPIEIACQFELPHTSI